MQNNSRLIHRDLSPQEFPRTRSILTQGVQEEVAPGFVAGLWQKSHPDEIRLTAAGNRRWVPSILPMLSDTVFDLASLTKVFATAPLTAVLVERGWLSWNTPLAAFFPDYSSSKIEIRHLLSHTAGFTAWEPFWEKIKKEFEPMPLENVPVLLRQKKMRQLVLAVQPEVEPETRVVYSDISFLLLGFVLEELTGMPLDQAVEKWVWKPLGIEGAFYRRVTQSVVKGILEGVAATEDCPWRKGVLQGQVHDDNCWAMGGYAGHAGAFGTVQDLLQFAKALLMGRFLSHQTLQAFWNRAPLPLGCERTLGWDTPTGNSSSAGSRFSTRSVGHLGFTGTSIWIDLDAELAVVLLSNRVHPSRENWKIKEFRPKFHEAIRLDIAR